MAFCKYCGAKLDDGAACTCDDAVKAAEAKAAAEKAEKEAAEKAAAEKSEADKNEVTVIPAVSSPEAAAAAEKRFMRRGLIIIAAVSVMFMLFIVMLAAVFGGGYKSPLKKAVKGINREDSALVISAFVPPEQLEDMADEADDGDSGWNDVTDDLDLFIEDMKDVCEEDYFGDRLRVSADITEKKDVSGRELRKIKKHFDELDTEVGKAYKLKVELTVKGDDETEEVRFNIYTVRVSGRKWLLYADDKTLGKLSDKLGRVYKEIKTDADEVVSDHKESLALFSSDTADKND